jgi:hypothetical protein
MLGFLSNQCNCNEMLLPKTPYSGRIVGCSRSSMTIRCSGRTGQSKLGPPPLALSRDMPATTAMYSELYIFLLWCSECTPPIEARTLILAFSAISEKPHHGSRTMRDSPFPPPTQGRVEDGDIGRCCSLVEKLSTASWSGRSEECPSRPLEHRFRWTPIQSKVLLAERGDENPGTS